MVKVAMLLEYFSMKGERLGFVQCPICIDADLNVCDYESRQSQAIECGLNSLGDFGIQIVKGEGSGNSNEEIVLVFAQALAVRAGIVGQHIEQDGGIIHTARERANMVE